MPQKEKLLICLREGKASHLFERSSKLSPSSTWSHQFEAKKSNIRYTVPSRFQEGRSSVLEYNRRKTFTWGCVRIKNMCCLMSKVLGQRQSIKLVVLVCLSKQIQAFFTFLSLISCVKFSPQMTFRISGNIYKPDAICRNNRNDPHFPSKALYRVLREGSHLK